MSLEHSFDTTFDSLDTFKSVPVFVYGATGEYRKHLAGVLVDLGVNYRAVDTLEELQGEVHTTPDAVVFFFFGVSAVEELDRLAARLDSHRTLLVACGEQLLSKPQLEHYLVSGIVADIIDQFVNAAITRNRCRLLIELQQRRGLFHRENQLISHTNYLKERLMEALPAGVIRLTNDAQITEVNEYVLNALGYGRENLVGAHVSLLLSEPTSVDPFLDWCEHPVYSVVMTQQNTHIEDTVMWRADGSQLPVDCQLATLYPGQEPEYFLVFQDISVRKAEEAELDQLTRYDPVTGLANMSLMRHFLLKAMARVLRNDRRLSILYVDLDDFHCINQSFGVSGGDSLLRSVGRRIKNCIRTGDLVSRYQNDAFIVVLDEVRHTSDVQKLARQMLDKLSSPHDLSGVPVVSHASIGIAFYPQGAMGIDELIDQAKEAMEWVKLNGKNGLHVFGNDELSASKSKGKAVVH